MFHRDASKSQLPGGGSSSFFREGFKVNQPTRDGLFPHSHWASEKLFGRCSTNLFNQEKHSPKHTNRKTKRDAPFGGSHTHMHIDVYHVALGHTHTHNHVFNIHLLYRVAFGEWVQRRDVLPLQEWGYPLSIKTLCSMSWVASSKRDCSAQLMTCFE